MKPRPIVIEGDIAIVPLTRGLVAIIDAADAHLVAGRNWHVTGCGHRTYAASKLNGKLVLMHRVIFGETDLYVDHADLDRFNNRRSNLRAATITDNNRNRRLQKNNTSGFKGVSWNRRERKWRAVVKHNGKCVHLGTFTSAEEAGRCFLGFTSKTHGDFWRAG